MADRNRVTLVPAEVVHSSVFDSIVDCMVSADDDKLSQETLTKVQESC